MGFLESRVFEKREGALKGGKLFFFLEEGKSSLERQP